MPRSNRCHYRCYPGISNAPRNSDRSRFSLKKKKKELPASRHRIPRPRFPGPPPVSQCLPITVTLFRRITTAAVDSPVLPFIVLTNPLSPHLQRVHVQDSKVRPPDMSPGRGRRLGFPCFRVMCAPNPYPIQGSSRIQNEAIGLGGMIPREKRDLATMGSLYRVLLCLAKGMYYSTQWVFSFFLR